MKIIVGLGNVGNKYDGTHHNIGFMMADMFAKREGIVFTKKKFDALIGEGFINGEKIILMKPTTYMNLSGKSVLKAAKKLKVNSSDILIIYDDIDLLVGKIRFRENGSGGTHNGMKNILAMMGTEDIPRLRIGIGKPENGDLINYVLGKIGKEDMEKLNSIKDEVFEKIKDFINKK